MLLKAVLREYLGSEELSSRAIALNVNGAPITIGRSTTCTYQVGNKFGDLVCWVARIQATIVVENGAVKLLDGERGRPSTNGVYCHSERIAPEILLTPGLQLTLFKAERAKVTLEIVAFIKGEAAVDKGNDTFTGEDLLDRLQEKVELLGGQIGAFSGQVGALHKQVELLGRQLSQREEIDINQERRLVLTEKRLYRLFAIVFGCVAAIVLASGWTGGSTEDKKLWASTLTAIVIGAVAAYIKAKEPQSEKLTQRT